MMKVMMKMMIDEGDGDADDADDGGDDDEEENTSLQLCTLLNTCLLISVAKAMSGDMSVPDDNCSDLR